MTNNYLLKDLDEFKIRYAKKRVEDKLYAIYPNNDIMIHCYNDSKDSYTHKFIVTDNDYFVSNREDVIMCRRLEKNILEIITIPSTLNKSLIEKAKLNLDKYMHKFNEMLTYLSLNKDCISYKDDEYLSWYYGIDLNELETIRKIYFYDKSIVPYEDVDIKEAKLEYELLPYSTIEDFEIDSIDPNNRLKNIRDDINRRQNKSKVKAKTIYTK